MRTPRLGFMRSWALVQDWQRRGHAEDWAGSEAGTRDAVVRAEPCCSPCKGRPGAALCSRWLEMKQKGRLSFQKPLPPAARALEHGKRNSPGSLDGAGSSDISPPGSCNLVRGQDLLRTSPATPSRGGRAAACLVSTPEAGSQVPEPRRPSGLDKLAWSGGQPHRLHRPDQWPPSSSLSLPRRTEGATSHELLGLFQHSMVPFTVAWWPALPSPCTALAEMVSVLSNPHPPFFQGTLLDGVPSPCSQARGAGGSCASSIFSIALSPSEMQISRT